MKEYITKDDLNKFRKLLLQDLEKMIQKDMDIISSSNQNEKNQWLRSKAVRNMLTLSDASLRNLRITGKVKNKKIMGSYYYNKADLLNLFK